MSDRDLRKLAELIYEMTRREIWLGGKVTKKNLEATWEYLYEMGGPWPEGMGEPGMGWSTGAWDEGHTWTMSPEVELGEYRLRVCVSSNGGGPKHEVRVFVDGELKYPGGLYLHKDKDSFLLFLASLVVPEDWIESWSTRLARIERTDGGKTGPVDRRDLLIVEAKQKLRGPARVQHELPRKELGEGTAERSRADAEVAAHLGQVELNRG